MASVKYKDHSLKEILDGIVQSQKKDIYAFSGGHLNEANLFRPPEQATHKPWKSARKSISPRLKDYKGEQPDSKVDVPESMINFCLGASGSIQLQSLPSRGPSGSRGPVKLTTSPHSRVSGSQRDDAVLVEELKLPEIMLKKKSNVGTHRFEPKREFLTGYKGAVTKKDQFTQLKFFESTILKIQDAKERNALHGSKVVNSHVERLKQEIENYKEDEDKSETWNYLQKLKIFSESFENIIDQSSTFKYVLDEIKKEYDEYISYLIQSQNNKSYRVQSQIQQMNMRESASVRMLQFETERVNQLEEHAAKMLEENERLRSELKKEEGLLSESADEDIKEYTPILNDPPALELVEQIEEAHATILEILDTIDHTRKEMQSDYVPTTVCTHLEQCIKETEVETQHLTSQKEYFEQSIADYEKLLQETIEEADTTEKDAKKVWKRINEVKSATDIKAVLTANESEVEVDEETKWSWYIS